MVKESRTGYVFTALVSKDFKNIKQHECLQNCAGQATSAHSRGDSIRSCRRHRTSWRWLLRQCGAVAVVVAVAGSSWSRRCWGGGTLPQDFAIVRMEDGVETKHWHNPEGCETHMAESRHRGCSQVQIAGGTVVRICISKYRTGTCGAMTMKTPKESA